MFLAQTASSGDRCCLILPAAKRMCDPQSAHWRKEDKIRLSSLVGMLSFTSRHGPSRQPRLNLSTGLLRLSTRSNQGHTFSFAMRIHVIPAMTSVESTEELPFTKQARAPLLSIQCVHKLFFRRCGHVSSTRRGPMASMSWISCALPSDERLCQSSRMQVGTSI